MQEVLLTSDDTEALELRAVTDFSLLYKIMLETIENYSAFVISCMEA